MRIEDANTNITSIRRMDSASADRDAVSRLAALDSHDELQAPVLGIEVEGKLLAAISLADGQSVADPFSRTAEMRALLGLRADQLREREQTTAHPVRRRRRGLSETARHATGSALSLQRWG